jgi:hypothetical protein
VEAAAVRAAALAVYKPPPPKKREKKKQKLKEAYTHTKKLVEGARSCYTKGLASGFGPLFRGPWFVDILLEKRHNLRL